MTYLSLDLGSLAQVAMVFAILIGGILFRYERTINEIKRRLEATESDAIRSQSESGVMKDWREKHDREAEAVKQELHYIAVSIGKISTTIEHILKKI